MNERAGISEVRLIVQNFASNGVRTEQELRDKIEYYIQLFNADVSAEDELALFEPTQRVRPNRLANDVDRR